jgi:two-component system alkaline phosphatase synthesis response regulator PhoP
VDFKNYEVRHQGTEIKCSQKELQLLRYLIEHAGQAVDKSDILEAVWGYSSNATSRTIDTHIARLRRKLDDRETNRIIQTVPTVGYKFVAAIK